MLRKPKSGWTDVVIGSFSDRASYLTDVPIKCLKAFIHALENNLPVAINFDAEGWEYMVIVDHYETHIISDNCDEGFIYKSIEINKEDLANELINDVEQYFDGWVDWECWKQLDDEHKRKRENELKLLLKSLKDKLI